jgi:aspartyl-tRNA(Asn)/glutamyl-tRNA(Gln) amidotransferase subunit A
MSIPCGFTPAGLPIGLQLIGRPFEEARLFQVAHGYETVAPGHTRRPPLVDQG